MRNLEDPVENPTWMADIRFFFTPEDIDHMGRLGIDLATYAGVKANAVRILGATEPPDATMPPDTSRQWSQARWDTFKNWIVNGYPFGTALPDTSLFLTASRARRVRRDARTLSTDDINLLKTAFEGIMRLPPDDPKGYFALAGIHWLPPPTYCLHHENRYNPWHRIYLHPFEDALRSIPGCEEVTVPYWDITSPIPDFLYRPPFDSYSLPRDIGDGFNAGYLTSRYAATQVASNIESFGIPGKINDALSKTVWSQFNRKIIEAHDNGHVSTGPTLAQQDVASYDPIFWFFHCNLDRLWWKWQQTVSATTLAGFLSTVTGSTDWLRNAPFNSLPPFAETADQTIDLSGHDVDYEHPTDEVTLDLVTQAFGSLPARELKRLHRAAKASVRVKGVNRLNIPGSFVVHLQADGRTISSQAFFQSRNPRACSACVKKGLVDIDLEADIDQLRSGDLSVVIEPKWPDAMGVTFPLSSAGDPTVNVRLLLE
ncbi:MAG: tyrosinase family protein [Acidobacteriota bacterium]|nr:tyrosinase family protein [Acidobacteriota bacterium]